MTISPADERRKVPLDLIAGRPRAATWREHHRLVASLPSSSGETVLGFQFGIHGSGPAGGPDLSASYSAALAQAGEAPIVLAEDDIVAPSVGWGFRSSALWADHNCETPLVHWSYGLEAFAIAIDDPAELLGRGHGDRVPLGWEIDFESEPEHALPIDGGYLLRGRLHGLLLTDEGERDVDGPAIRWHWWGDTTPPQVASAPEPEAIALPGPDEVWYLAPDSIAELLSEAR